MNLSLIRSMTRSAVFELENGKCFRPEHPFAVALNGKTIYESCNTNVFSLFSLTPSTAYTVEVTHPATASSPTARPTTPAGCRLLFPPAPGAARYMSPLAATAPPASS